jgi:hypothetical protein
MNEQFGLDLLSPAFDGPERPSIIRQICHHLAAIDREANGRFFDGLLEREHVCAIEIRTDAIRNLLSEIGGA